MTKTVMAKTIRLLPVGAFVLGAALAPPALGEVVDIDVEVIVTNLPEDAEPKVECMLHDSDGNLIGRGVAIVPADQNYHDHIIVSVTRGEGILESDIDEDDPGSPDNFSCYLTLKAASEEDVGYWGPTYPASQGWAVQSWDACEEELDGLDPEPSPSQFPFVCGRKGELVRGTVEGTME